MTVVWTSSAEEAIESVIAMRKPLPERWSDHVFTEVKMVSLFAPRLQRAGIEGLQFSTFDNCREFGAVYAAGEHVFAVFSHRHHGTHILTGRRREEAEAGSDEFTQVWPYHLEAPMWDGLGFASQHEMEPLSVMLIALRDCLAAAAVAPAGIDTAEIFKQVAATSEHPDIWKWD